MNSLEEIDVRLINKKNLGLDIEPPKEKKFLKPNMEAKKEDIEMLEQFRRYYDDLGNFLARRKRNRKYYRGDQWSDTIEDEHGNSITEEDYIKDQGKVPLKQNLIRSLMKNLIGQQQQNPIESIVLSTKRKDAKLSEMLTNTLKYVHQINDGEHLDRRLFEEFGLSGSPIRKISFQYNRELDRHDIFFENIDPRRFVYNTDIVDPRIKDVRMVGEIIDATIDDLVTQFAKNKREENIIRNIYKDPKRNEFFDLPGGKPDSTDDIAFYVPYDHNKCRVFEIWYLSPVWGVDYHDYATGEDGFLPETTLEDIEKLNDNRLKRLIEEGIVAPGTEKEDVKGALIEAKEIKRQEWRYKFLTPNGYCLYEDATPFLHNEHPYSWILYPLVDGESWGFVEDVIDQQRYVNRLITLMDFIISSGAKGVWLIPEESKPDDMEKQDYIDELVKVGGAVYYKPKPGVDPPQQVYNKSMPVGVTELLTLQMRLAQDVSGIQPAAQGQEAKSGTPASRYAQEAQYAATNIVDYLKTFSYFRKKFDMKLLKTIVQYYTDKRYLNIAGVDYQKEAVEYDPEMIDDLDFDIVVTESYNTPVYRTMIDETLLELLNSQAITIEQYLENTSAPFADKLLESVRQNNQNMMQGQIPPELMEQVNQQADPQTMRQINNSINSA